VAEKKTDPFGVLLSVDLIFTTKIRSTARELGYQIVVAGSDSAAGSLMELREPKVVLVDLTAGAIAAPAALGRYRKLAPTAWFIAFGPHVDDAALAEARAAGCQIVLPRSKFAATLPELLHQCFGRPDAPSTIVGPQ
jgi:hypothetical protein